MWSLSRFPIITTPITRTAEPITWPLLGGWAILSSNRQGHAQQNRMPYLVIMFAVQVALIVHVIRTGRNSLWIWAIALIPRRRIHRLPHRRSVAGSRPQPWSATRDGGVRRTFDPHRDLRRYSNEVKLSGNIDSRRRYADELSAHGEFDAAIEAYRGALNGLYEHDPQLLLGLARAQFGKASFRDARESLDRLIRQNPDFKSADGTCSTPRRRSEGNLDRLS